MVLSVPIQLEEEEGGGGGEWMLGARRTFADPCHFLKLNLNVFVRPDSEP